jgi:G-patch domain
MEYTVVVWTVTCRTCPAVLLRLRRRALAFSPQSPPAQAVAEAMKLPASYLSGQEVGKATAMGGFGQHMLERMGWHAGEGLGKERQGRSAPVLVKKKADTKGLGEKLGWDWGHDYASSAFDNALAAFAGPSGASPSSCDSSDSEDTDCLRNSDGTASSATAAELRLARQLAKGSTGRFGCRAGKLARIREQEALLASVADPMQAGKPLQDRKASAAAHASAPERRKGIVLEVPGCESDRGTPARPPSPQPSAWWGRRQFTSGGWLGSTEQEVAQKREAFSEDTQVALYTSLQQMQAKVRCCCTVIPTLLPLSPAEIAALKHPERCLQAQPHAERCCRWCSARGACAQQLESV